MVSIALTVVVVFFLYKALDTQKQSNAIITRRSLVISNKDALFKLFYADIYESNQTHVQTTFNKDFDIVYLATKNSLHQIPFAYVVYYVNPQDKTLVRLESAHPFKLPVDLEKIQYLFADTLIKNVKKFRLFTAMSKNSREPLPGETRKSKKEKTEQKYLLFFLSNQEKNIFEIFK
ncbi:general secretion pathway protein J (plasmid) [Nitratiruptor sp. YY09-18]|nr:general secretion pathway protein J [Nitratiruptor sp. YY09-18]